MITKRVITIVLNLAFKPSINIPLTDLKTLFLDDHTFTSDLNVHYSSSILVVRQLLAILGGSFTNVDNISDLIHIDIQIPFKTEDERSSGREQRVLRSPEL